MPDEVMELILKRLPTRSLIRFKVVCRRWQQMISSPKLHTDNIGPPFEEEWMLMIPKDPHGEVLHAFLPQLNKWQTMHLPKKISPTFPFIDAAGGNLICMSDRGHCKGTSTRVLVCNPVMRTWRELPPLQNPGQIKCMGFNPETKAFKVLATASDWRSYAEIYDSDLNCWRMVASPLPPKASDTPPVYCNSCFYFLGADFNLYELHTERHVWKEVRTSRLFLGIGVTCEDKKLTESDGQIMLFTVSVDLYGKKDLTVWTLNPGMKWERAARPPWNITSHFLNGCESFSLLATRSGQTIYLKNMQMCRVAQADLDNLYCEGKWGWIPESNSVPHRAVLQPFWT